MATPHELSYLNEVLADIDVGEYCLFESAFFHRACGEFATARAGTTPHRFVGTSIKPAADRNAAAFRVEPDRHNDAVKITRIGPGDWKKLATRRTA